MDNTKNHQRNESSNRSVEDEVQKLFKTCGGKINQQDFVRLRYKFGDEDFVEKIHRRFIELYATITKKAKKFAKLIRQKYYSLDYPFHIILEKAYKYKNQYKLSDAVFKEFQRIYENELLGIKSTDLFKMNTNMQKILGNVNVDYQGFTEKLSDTDYKILQDILKLNATSKPLHSQVFIQSLQYNDTSYEVVAGKYNRDIHNVANHVHPVIAALFIPKIDCIEQHFIMSNISNIVKTRYNKEPFSSMADALLYDALIKDPNDVVCDGKSILCDLYNRALLQNQLWNAVLSLRNGQIYNTSFKDFINTIDMCKMNKYDSPDLIYARHDGTILKRLLSAFSFNPTIITTTPVYTLMATNPYQQIIKPMVTYIPMINIKLPYSINDDSVIELDSFLEHEQALITHGYLEQKMTSLIYSKGVLIFYIDRRTHIIYNNAGPSFSFPNIPISIAGFDKINNRYVNYRSEIKIRQDTYQLRSVVTSEIKYIKNTNYVIGSSTLIMKHQNIEEERFTDTYWYYNPYLVVASPENNTRWDNPIILLPPDTNIDRNNPNNTTEGFRYIASTRGIIFIYQLVVDNSNGNITF